jgi:hypothetical protein
MEEYKIPQEHQNLPPEHTLPEEFSATEPMQTEKKKSTSRRWMAMIAATFMTMQLMFSYFVPPTKDVPNDPIFTEPGYQDPGGSGSSSTDKPSYNIGGFEVKSLDADVDDTILRSYLEDAAQHFENFDYVRASLALFQTMRYYDTGVSFSDLPMVGYSVLNGTAQDFDASATMACHVYYSSEATYFENKIGEMEAVYGTRAILVRMQQTERGRSFRVISLWVSFDQSFSGSTDYTADYIEGVFTADGSSDFCTRINFSVFESTNYPDFDEKYAVWAHGMYTGSVAAGAYMNGTLLETRLTYVDGQGIVNDPDQEPLNIRFQCLDEQGVVDLKYPALSNMTDGFDPEVNDRFYNDPSVRYMAQLHALGYKYDGSEENAWIEVLDITEPLLPLNMHSAFCIGQIIADNQPDTGDNERPDLGDIELPNVDMSLYSPGLIKASDLLMADDYVGASIALTDTFRANYSSELNDVKLIYVDGSIHSFAGQDLTDGTGTYITLIEQIVMVYNDKADDYDPEMHLFATLIHVSDLDTGETDTKIVSVEIPHYYLGQNVDYTYADVEFFDGLVEEDFHGDMLLLSYSLNGSSGASGSTSRDGYYISANYQVENSLTGGVAGLETRYKDCGLQLNDDKTALIPKGALQDYVNIVDLDSAGVLVDPEKIAEVDLTALDPSSDAFFNARDEWVANPNVRYILYSNGNGERVLYVKNVIYKAGESHRALWIYEDQWSTPLFQPSDTLPVWISVYRQIRQ